MITFIKDYDLSTLKDKFILLYAVIIGDFIFRLTSLFRETNSLDANSFSFIFLIIAIKLAVPGMLLYFCNYRIQEATQAQLKKANILISLTFIVLFIASNANAINSPL